MDSADSALKNFFVRLTSPEVLAEVIAIVFAALVALACAQAVRAWHRRHNSPADRISWQSDVMEGAVILAPIFFALILLLVIRATLGSFQMHTAVVDTALQLSTALLLVRTAAYGL